MANIIVILGPTASGKSALAVEIAKRYNGEIISADSRQVYKDLNIGTGKITKREMQGIPHHLLNVISPKTKSKFTVQDFKKQAGQAIETIIKKNKLPIICGGTGFYIQSIVDNISFPEVKPDKPLRKKLERKSVVELFKILIELDPLRASTVDPNNPVRLIRAIEIATTLGSVPSVPTPPPLDYKNSKHTFLQIGIETDDFLLKEKIKTRLLARIKKGMIQEVEKLHKNGLSYKRMEELGLEYRYLALYLQKKLTKEEMLTKLETEIWHYAKRQKTWFKRDTRIRWFPLENQKEIESAMERFLK